MDVKLRWFAWSLGGFALGKAGATSPIVLPLLPLVPRPSPIVLPSVQTACLGPQASLVEHSGVNPGPQALA